MFNHKQIHRFDECGEVDDKYFAATRQSVLSILVERMRERGYVRQFDLDDQWTLDYNGKTYQFKLSVYGTYVGKRRAKCLLGLVGTRPIYIQNNRSRMPLSSLV